MQMRVAACQRKRHLDRRRHRHFDFQAPIARVMPLDEIGAKSGATTGKTDDVIELGHPPEGPQPEASRSISR